MKVEYYNSHQVRYALSNLESSIRGRGNVENLLDLIEDNIKGDPVILVRLLGIMLYNNPTLDRVTDTYVRIKMVDKLGNVTYLKCYK